MAMKKSIPADHEGDDAAHPQHKTHAQQTNFR
jgi:hypothetical protein